MALRTDGEEETGQSVLDFFEDWYHVPVLLVVAIVMLRIRLLSYDSFVRGDDVLFSGNDAWYHLREVNYTVRHWPTTMPFDPWTYFPYGTSVGQFGTLYDQIVATAALIVGLGSPSSELVAKTLLVAPAVGGALTVVPVYFIGKRLSGRGAGLFGAIVLGLLPGLFLQRTLVGVADHNAVEPFFQAVAVLGMLAAVAVAEREKPVWELVETRDVEALRPTLVWAVLGGLAVTAYMYTWPPGVIVVGIVGIFAVVKMASDVANERSPEPVAFAVAVSMAVAGLLTLVQIEYFNFSSTQFSLIQPVAAFGVAGGAAFLAWLARQWDARDISPDLFPLATFGLVLAGFGLSAVVLPDLYGLVADNLLRIAGFNAGAQTRTIGEAQPYLDPGNLRQFGFVTDAGTVDRVGRILNDYGFTMFTAVLAVVWMLAKPLYREGETVHYGYIAGGVALVGLLFIAPGIPAGIGDLVGVDGQLVGLAAVAAILVGATLLASYSAVELLVLSWAFLTTSMAFTQLRFHYYLAVVVAVLNAYLFGEALRLVDLRSFHDVLDIDLWQAMTVVMVVLVITAPVLLVPLSVRNTGNAQFDSSQTAWQTAESGGPGNVVNWDGSLQWLSDQTPREGTLGGGGDSMEYYGTYDRTDDFSYPSGAYGVQSWWDYGHWITVRGERIPNANPFQEGAVSAANYLLAPSESAAEDVLASQSSEGENTRYVMVDWQMATPGSKFGAPVVFYNADNVSQSDFYAPVYASRENNYQRNFQLRTQRYYDSQMVRLYEYHGSAMEPQPVVVDWVEEGVTNRRTGQQFTVRAAPSGNESVLKTFDNMTAAREYVEEDGSAQVGGIGPYPSERVPALEHYRLAKVSNRSALQAGGYVNPIRNTLQVTGLRDPSLLYRTQPSWVKTFERVPGATIEGSNARPNATVSAVVQMRVPTSGETFQYTQQTRADQNGEFTMTLPYSTTGYAQYGPENGYTNVSVRATADHYVIRGGGSVQTVDGTPMVVQRGANVTVPEGKVNGDDPEPIEVELEERSEPLQIQGGGGSGASGQNDLDELPDSDVGTDESPDGETNAAVTPSARRPASLEADPAPVPVTTP